MLITIVTVCYNAESSIEKTMNSVLSQSYDNIEYIVKDGCSTDWTNECVEEYRNKFEKRGIKFQHVVQKDMGIYDAMNQATVLASGEYINYMNAGDTFFDSHVVANIFGSKKYSGDVIYGDSVCKYEFIEGKCEYTLWRGQNQCFKRMPFSHQACFFRTEIIKKYYYDTRFRSAADFHLLIRLHKDGKNFDNAHCIISVCTMDGVSNTRIVASYRETIRAKMEVGMKELMPHVTFFGVVLMCIKQFIIEVFPDRLVGRLLRFQVKRKGNRIYRDIEEIADCCYYDSSKICDGK